MYGKQETWNLTWWDFIEKDKSKILLSASGKLTKAEAKLNLDKIFNSGNKKLINIANHKLLAMELAYSIIKNGIKRANEIVSALILSAQKIGNDFPPFLKTH